MRLRTLTILLFSVLFAGCGGGGGSSTDEKERLVVSFHYPIQQTSASTLSVPISVAPVIDGLKSYTPHCTLISGSLPQGLSVKDNCTISGTPQSSGTFFFGVRLTADNAEGFVDSSGSFVVRDPTPAIAVVRGQVFVQDPRVDQQIVWNMPLVDFQVATSGYEEATTEQISFAVVSGSLPVGLVMNSSTGRLSGTPTAQGLVSFGLTATLRRGNLTYVSAPRSVTLYVAPLSAQVSYAACAPAIWAVLWRCTPTIENLPTGATIRFSMSFLGDVFSVDPATGTISGLPNGPGDFAPQSVGLVTLADGATYQTFAIASTGTVPPSPNWGSNNNDNSNMTGVVVPADRNYFGPFNISIRVLGGQPFAVGALAPHAGLAGDSYVYTIEPYSDFLVPGWVTLDAATGRVSGTAPSVSGSDMFQIRLTTTRNGRSATSGIYLWQIVQ